jgi:hypothetical protein
MAGLAGAVPGEAVHLVARHPLFDTVADVGHHPGQIAALAGGEGRREPVVEPTFPDGRFTRVDAGGLDRHHHLTGGGDGQGDLRDVEHLATALVVESHCPGRVGHRILGSP